MCTYIHCTADAATTVHEEEARQRQRQWRQVHAHTHTGGYEYEPEDLMGAWPCYMYEHMHVVGSSTSTILTIISESM